MEILVLCDDLWHPAEIVEKGLAFLPKEEFQFTFVKTAKDILTVEYINKFPIIINAKANMLNASSQDPWFEDGVTEVGPAEFEKYIEEGHGFISLHGGNAVTKDVCPEMEKLIGNRFITHPPRCLVDFVPVGEHPILKGVERFSHREEHYRCELLDKDADIFLKSYSVAGGEQISGYTRKLGKGRICAFFPGHTLSMWEELNFQKILINAIYWVSKKDV